MATTLSNSSGGSYGNQYDLQKQKIRDEEAQTRKAAQGAIQRRLASRGFTAGSGYTESQQNRADTEMRAGERNRLTDVDISQLAAGEAANEAQKARTWQTGERLGSEAAALKSQTQAEQNAGTQAQAARTWQGTQNEADRVLRQQEINNAADLAQSKVDFDYWATERGYTAEEASRAWEERQGILQRNAAAEESDAARKFTLEMTGYQEQLKRGTLQLQDQIDQNNNSMKTHMDYLFSLGQNNVPVDTSGMSQLEIDSYNMGKSGRLKSDYDQYVQNKIDLRNQLILTLVESPALSGQITDLFNEFESLIDTSGLYGVTTGGA